MSESKMRMKLMVDKTKNKVIFAEAGKECVDFFFHVLSLPLGSITGYLTKESMVGSIGSLYGSLESLKTDYLQDGVDKDCLLDPKPSSWSGQSHVTPLLSMVNKADPSSKKVRGYTAAYYTCAKHFNYSDAPRVKCPDCQGQINEELKYVASTKDSSINGGYVKGLVTYMITDDLCVHPTSAMLSIELLNKFNVQDVGRLAIKEVNLDINQGLSFLKASLMSKTVLTDVFLAKKSIYSQQ